MLELAILGLLKEQPMHGYQLSQRAQRVAGRLLAGLLRLALPVAPAPGEGGRRRERPERRGARRTSQERLPRHGEGREALLRAAAGDAARQLHRGHTVPRPPRVLQVPAAGDADPPAGTAPRPPRGPAVHHQGLAARPPASGSTTYTLSLMEHGRERHRTRHRVARRPDPGRAPTAPMARPQGARSAGAPPRASQKGARIMSKVRLGDRRRGELRLVARPGTRVLQGRRPRRHACPA